MQAILDAPLTGAALFHSRAGGFPLHLCTYALLDEHSNDTDDLDQIAVIRVTAHNGERFRLRDPAEIRRFLAAVGRISDEVES
ncbi:MAG: hypothetical protein HXY37_18980 [Chloroflexi bacterium]|nr:hypothetical protein [Chloroflexota bacterium]